MLIQLKIENYALIKFLDISPCSTLNMITGETGAGKSIMLGAVGLLLGKRADTKVLSDNEKKCIIEGIFDVASYKLIPFFEEEDLDYAENTIIRREITPAGKSRAFINDTPVTLEVMKRLGVHLMDVHSQHDTLSIRDNSFQLSLIDHYAGNEELLTKYQHKYKKYKAGKSHIQNLEQDILALQNEHDYHQFLLNELATAQLQEDEQLTLEQELSLLDNSEEIKGGLYLITTLLSNGEQTVESSLQEVKSALQKLSSLSPQYRELYLRIESTYIELKDISTEIEVAADEVIFDPDRIYFVKERLGLIYQLQQKHKVNSITQLLEIENDLADTVVKSSEFEEELTELRAVVDQLDVEVKSLGEKLSQERQKAFEPLKGELETLLHDVGMPDALVYIQKENTAPSTAGTDKLTLLFSANKGVSPAAISEVASGGELSRLMFCVKYILADKTALPTIIFDEIDTGVSGEVAIKMGRMMSSMAANHQVLTITHLPQIAAMAEFHYFVYKDEEKGRAVSKVRLLNEKERVDEIATMIGGDKPSDAAYDNAKELIQT